MMMMLPTVDMLACPLGAAQRHGRDVDADAFSGLCRPAGERHAVERRAVG